MPIPVTCSCGKRFAAPDNLAGKRVKCPACSQTLTIPQPASSSTAPEAAAQPNAIRVRCECGKTLTVKQELAGKAIKCPACGKPVRVGAPQPKPKAQEADPGLPSGEGVGDLLDEVDLGQSSTGHRCPVCRADLQEDDIICVQCGYNFETGRKIETKTVRKPSPIQTGKGPAKKNRKSNDGGFQIDGKVALLIGLLIALPTLALYIFNPALGTVVVSMAAQLIGLAAYIWLIVIGFRDSVLSGVVMIFCGIYTLYFIAVNFDECKVPAAIWLVCTVVSVGLSLSGQGLLNGV